MIVSYREEEGVFRPKTFVHSVEFHLASLKMVNRCTFRLRPGAFLWILHKSGSESEKRPFLLEKDEKSSLHFVIDMLILYLLKVGPFGGFLRKTQFFPI